MSISADFTNAVKENQTERVRIMLRNSMMSDLTLRKFDEWISYAESELPDLYDEHDGEQFTSDITEWNQELLDDQSVTIIDNFSKERIAFLKKLCRHVYADKAEEMDREAFIEEEKKKLNSKQLAGAGIVAGGAVAAVVGVAKVGTIGAAAGFGIAAAGLAAVAVGGVIIYKNR